jgi:intraflagellar transport protein 56
MLYHNKLGDGVEDKLTLASIQYLRKNYEEAADIYKQLLAENR